MSNSNIESNKHHGKPCVKCGETLRYKRGDCVNCTKRRVNEYRQENPGKVRESKRKSGRKHYYKNIDKIRAKNRKWHHDNQDRSRENNRKWKRDNPTKAAASCHRYRARIRGNESKAYDFKAICAHYDNRCVKCGKNDVKLTVDHIIPVSKGGANRASNIQPLCGICNSIKGMRNIDYRPDVGPMRWIQAELLT